MRCTACSAPPAASAEKLDIVFFSTGAVSTNNVVGNRKILEESLFDPINQSAACVHKWRLLPLESLSGKFSEGLSSDPKAEESAHAIGSDIFLLVR